VRFRAGLLRGLAIMWLRVLARLEVGAAIAAIAMMLRLLAIAIAAMAAAAAPAAPAPSRSVIRSAVAAAVLTVLRKLLPGLRVTGSARFVNGLLA